MFTAGLWRGRPSGRLCLPVCLDDPEKSQSLLNRSRVLPDGLDLRAFDDFEDLEAPGIRGDHCAVAGLNCGPAEGRNLFLRVWIHPLTSDPVTTDRSIPKMQFSGSLRHAAPLAVNT